jgi:hypothetical protein
LEGVGGIGTKENKQKIGLFALCQAVWKVNRLKTCDKTVPSRVARFFAVQFTKTGKIYQMTTKYTKVKFIITNGRIIDQMTITYNIIFHCKTLQNLPKMGFLVWK